MRKPVGQHKVTRKTKSGKVVTYMRGRGSLRKKGSLLAGNEGKEEVKKKLSKYPSWIANRVNNPGRVENYDEFVDEMQRMSKAKKGKADFKPEDFQKKFPKNYKKYHKYMFGEVDGSKGASKMKKPR